jgi:hypothetical protein
MGSKYAEWVWTGSSSTLKVKRLWWQERGLQKTASGYGDKIPTEYMAKPDGVWRRVYCSIFSNIGTLYIMVKGQRVIVNIDKDDLKNA